MSDTGEIFCKKCGSKREIPVGDWVWYQVWLGPVHDLLSSLVNIGSFLWLPLTIRNSRLTGVYVYDLVFCRLNYQVTSLVTSRWKGDVYPGGADSRIAFRAFPNRCVWRCAPFRLKKLALQNVSGHRDSCVEMYASIMRK